MNTTTKALAVITLTLVNVAANSATFTINPNPVETSAGFNNGPINGGFTDTWNFTVSKPVTGAASVTNIGINNTNISGFKAVIDGTYQLLTTTANGVLNTASGVFNLATGGHYLTISGTGANGASYGGNLAVSTSVGAVPVPGAVWLFGSALAGLVGLTRKKAK